MNTAFPADWLVPDWPAPASVGAVFTTRAGGMSAAPFDSFNLGDHVQDDPAAVQANHSLLAEYTAARPVFLQQVHGTDVVPLTPAMCAPGTPPVQADACFVAQAGLACTIMVADCLPVLLTHRHAAIVGAAHAGWRGLAGGVLKQLLHAMHSHVRNQTGSHAAASADGGWLAWLGPCIGQAAFEVGDEVRATFVQHAASAGRCFAPGVQVGKWQADLAALARQRLQALGVQAVYGNNGDPSWCTWSQPQRFYSYRRQARTGRMAAAIWLRSQPGVEG